MTNRKADRDLLLELVQVLSISRSNLRRDPCGNWNLVGRRGHISTDGIAFYTYVQLGTRRRWEKAKRTLDFMTVTQDGDDEGVLKLQGSPTADQAATIRKVLGLRKATPLSDERREALRQAGRHSVFAGDKPSDSAPDIDFPEGAATNPASTPQNAPAHPVQGEV